MINRNYWNTTMRGEFAYQLYLHMAENKNIYLITADLGYKMFDLHFRDFPKQTFNVGAAEQIAMAMAVGMALEGKIPVVYSITPFLLYRPFETIRTYINHENLSVKMVGSGRDNDYKHDGFSHYAGDDHLMFFNIIDNIQAIWPKEISELNYHISRMLTDTRPYYLNLKK